MNNLAVISKRHFEPMPCSFAEYLALEEASEARHEYRDGMRVPMADSSADHSVITVNVAGELHQRLKRQSWLMFCCSMRVLTASGLATYPDVIATSNEPQFEDEKQTTLTNPQLIVEVLSDSTEAYDRGKKFDHYKSIASLREYILVAQDRVHVDHFARQDDDRWILTAYDELEAAVDCPVLGCSIPMAEVYANVEFDEAKPATPTRDVSSPDQA